MWSTRVLRCLVAVCAVFALAAIGADRAAAQATPCADLLITSIDVTPVEPVQGQPANIAITVRNAGSCAAGGFVVQFKTDLFATTGPSRSVTSLAAGASTTLNLSFNFPTSGNFESVVQVDTGGAVAETNEVNNLEIKSITVLPPGINLVVSGFSLAPDPVVQGRVATASITVTNTGNVPAGAFRVEWTPLFLAAPLSRQVNGLAAGASTTVTFDFTFPFAATVTGTATVDSSGMVAETDEFDNTATLQTVVEPPLPNLAFAKGGEEGGPITIHEAPAGSVSSIDITVVNDGNNPAGDFVVRWQPWLFGAPLTQQVDGLAVGQSTTVSFDYTFPFPGTFDGTVTLDSTSAVAEVDETDNTASTRFVIPVATVDLTVSDLTISPSSPTQGAPSTTSVTVTNLGNSPSGRFVVDWNPDAFAIIVPSVQTLSEETGPLGPGESRTIDFAFTYPQAGNFRSIAHADSFNTVNETNEANNDRILNVTVQPAPIDLVFDGPIVFNPAQPVRGVNATASVTVRNAGPIATGSFGVQFKSQDGDFFPQTQFVNGLNPGETRTLSFTVNYFAAGSFTATATLDVFNQVNEAAPGGEANNVENQGVTVVPQSATLNVTLDNLTVFNDLDPPPIFAGDGEWHAILFAVFDPTASCDVNVDVNTLHIHQTIPSVRCLPTIDGGSVDDHDGRGGNISLNRTIQVKLEEATPLIAAVAALEEDTLVPDFGGFATFLSFKPDYLHLSGAQTLPGMGCATISLIPPSSSPVSGGHCYDAHLSVTPVSVVGPALAAGAKAGTVAVAAKASKKSKASAPLKVTAKVKREAKAHLAYLQHALSGLKSRIRTAVLKQQRARR